MNPQTLQIICFYVFSLVAVAAALSVITLKNTVHAVLALVLTFFSAACLWILLDAEFLALALVVVYVGAVMVLFLFVVMMLDIDLEKMHEGFVKFLPVGVIVAVVMLAEMLGLIGVRAMHARDLGADPAAVAGVSNTAWLGQALYTKFLLPFEVAALVLTVGLVAAVALTLRERRDARYESASRQVRVDPRDRVRIVKMDAVRQPPAADEGSAGESKP
ncbi:MULTISPECIES: NADH-quinone oxidoreductase subunit J [Rhodanobacter]|uniref:NADH-quinone oxidoreductase subunit J n=1 Tax=Rhodanobacter TaxID=75309 RepID=UPI000415AEA5|nr:MULTISPECIES: NADH-quinone oxidoreductase subunit J [Rhodanobacter]TAN16423.1 MAG: NADH-quinone oxidoreductase subunit J [Rhodanobacter sp.]UJJ53144.1 NADH-quinone oxidoreductase subunit J [Rhodanobacter thiooxydans]